MQQWIALYLPNLPLEALTRALATPEPQAVAEHHRIVACDGKAAARGVRPGLSTAAASALARELAVHPRNPAEETECLLGLAGWAAQYTPSVALEFRPMENAALALEVSGSLKLFRGLERIAASLRDGCARMGFTALVAAAPTARGASWLAHAGSEALIADPAALEDALAGLPVRVMTGDDAALEALAAIGATRVGDVIALPRGGLARRFGPRLLDDLDRALGRAPDPRTFFTPPAEFRARLELPAEVTQTEALLFAAKRLFVQLEGFLAARAGGVQRLALRLFHREARFTEVPIGLVAPARDAAHFTLLARERLGGLALPEAVRAIALDAGDVVPLAGEALALFDDGASSPGDWKKSRRAAPRPARRRGRALSRRCRGAPAGARFAGMRCRCTPARDGRRCGPLRAAAVLAPARAAAARGDRRRTPQRGGPLKLLAGPERIESGWWDGGDVARDYFVAETADRTLVWVYRERRPPGGWFLHGLFA